MINKTISYYFNSNDSRSRIYYNFDHILGLIASDPELSKQTDMVRKQTTEEAYKDDNTNPEHHYNLFRQVKQRLYPRTDEFDKSCHNLSRTFFLSHDPEAYERYVGPLSL